MDLVDPFGRTVRDLRISVTDRCNFRCTYCMPKEIFGADYAFLPRSEVLTFEEIERALDGAHMCFIAAGMGGGTGTGAAPVIAKTARDMGILTVGVVTKPFHFEGMRRMRTAEAGIAELHKVVDTLLIIPNQNLFRVANEKTTFADAFAMADQVLYSGVACITDLMVKEGLINLDFADVRAVMREMGKAMMGTGEMARTSRSISNPSRWGIMTSSMIKSTGLLRKTFSPSSPFAALTTAKSARSSAVRIKSTNLGSSSTTRMRLR